MNDATESNDANTADAGTVVVVEDEYWEMYTTAGDRLVTAALAAAKARAWPLGTSVDTVVESIQADVDAAGKTLVATDDWGDPVTGAGEVYDTAVREALGYHLDEWIKTVR